MSQELVIVEKQDSVACVTLNRPEALNALSVALRGAIAETFQALASNPQIQVIILTGAGRAFTVGLDLKELGGEVEASTSTSARNMMQAIAATPQPVIGAVNGYAITGGFELALMCDFLIASSEAKFADTHARVGVVPGWGLSQKLPRMIGINRAKELSLTGNYLDADTAWHWGLVNRVVRPEELLPICQSLARDIATTEPVTRREILHIMDAGWHTTLEDGLTIEKTTNVRHGKHQVTPEKIATRRPAVQARGRDQSS
jgi:enoyl-CoA hydratase